MLKIKTKCLPSWDAFQQCILLQWSDSFPRCQGHVAACVCADAFCLFWNLEETHSWFFWCSLLWLDIKPCWKLDFSKSFSQSNLSSWIPGYSPQFGANKIFLFLFWASQVALVVKNLPANAGDVRDTGLIPGLGRSPGGGHGNPLQYSCLENPMDWGAWRVTGHRVSQSRAQLKQLSRHIPI